MLADRAVARHADQAGHDLARVDRVEQHTFGAREQAHGFDHPFVRHAVLRLPVAADAVHVLGGDRDAEFEQVANGLRFALHQRGLIGRITADADAGQGHVDVVGEETGEQAAMCAGAARTDDHAVDL